MSDATFALLRSSPKTRSLTENAASGNKRAWTRLARAYGRETANAMIAASQSNRNAVTLRQRLSR